MVFYIMDYDNYFFKLLQRLSACDCLSEDSTERWKEARWTNLIAGSGLLAGLMGYSERKL